MAASIVFGRSVYHFLQTRATQRGADPGFAKWFGATRASLAGDRVIEFFRRERDIVLKERHRPVARRVSVTFTADAVFVGRLDIKVMRGQPWYRRSPSILWEDARRAVIQPIRRLISLASALKRRLLVYSRAAVGRLRLKVANREDRVSVRDFFYLEDPEGMDRNALDLVAEYLTRLDAIVSEAEAMYPRSVD